MDRGEFAASLSDEQLEFIKMMRDDALEEAKMYMDTYKEHGINIFFEFLTRNIAVAERFHFLLNEPVPDAYIKIYTDYVNICK